MDTPRPAGRGRQEARGDGGEGRGRTAARSQHDGGVGGGEAPGRRGMRALEAEAEERRGHEAPAPLSYLSPAGRQGSQGPPLPPRPPLISAPLLAALLQYSTAGRTGRGWRRAIACYDMSVGAAPQAANLPSSSRGDCQRPPSGGRHVRELHISLGPGPGPGSSDLGGGGGFGVGVGLPPRPQTIRPRRCGRGGQSRGQKGWGGG